jgi:hypothetical protein
MSATVRPFGPATSGDGLVHSVSSPAVNQFIRSNGRGIMAQASIQTKIIYLLESTTSTCIEIDWTMGFSCHARVAGIDCVNGVIRATKRGSVVESPIVRSSRSRSEFAICAFLHHPRWREVRSRNCVVTNAFYYYFFSLFPTLHHWNLVDSCI